MLFCCSSLYFVLLVLSGLAWFGSAQNFYNPSRWPLTCHTVADCPQPPTGCTVVCAKSETTTGRCIAVSNTAKNSTGEWRDGIIMAYEKLADLVNDKQTSSEGLASPNLLIMKLHDADLISDATSTALKNNLYWME